MGFLVSPVRARRALMPMTMTGASGVAVSRWLVGLAVAAGLAAAILQALEVRQLRQSVEQWRRRAQWPAAGVGFPPLEARSLDGARRFVGAGPSRAQVIVVFSTSCPFCRATLPAWRQLAARLDSLGTPVDMVWLSLSPRDSPRQYVGEQRLPYDRVAVDPDIVMLRAARIRGVPLTVVVDSRSIVRHVHAGRLTPLQADSVILAARESQAFVPMAVRLGSR